MFVQVVGLRTFTPRGARATGYIWDIVGYIYIGYYVIFTLFIIFDTCGRLQNIEKTWDMMGYVLHDMGI
jgi:hypothetical protein